MITKHLGEAATEAERAIETVIAAVPDWVHPSTAYSPVGGGISNANWRVAIVGAPHDYFVKVPGRGTEMFIDRTAAHDASRHAAMVGCGPAVIAFLEEHGVEIFAFITGRTTSTNDDFARPAVRRNAALALKRYLQLLVWALPSA